MPLLPMVEDAPPLELELELEADPPEDDGVLPRSVPPNRLVADLNAEEAFWAELDDDPLAEELLPDEELEEPLEEGVDVDDGVELPAEADGSRKESPRLPRNCGVTRDT